MGVVTVSAPYGANKITLETGRLARQADGAVLVTQGDTVVLVTVCGSKSARPGVDFLPLTVEYVEKQYAAGKIPGGYFKREGRLANWEILTSRLIDRPNRPQFPKHWRKEIQIIATVMSTDNENDPGILAMVGASAAVSISDIPFDGPTAGCRVAKIGGQFVINPSLKALKDAELELVVAGTADAVCMVEGEASEASEATIIDAILAAHEAIKGIIALQRDLVQKAGKPKQDAAPPPVDAVLYNRVIDVALDNMADALAIRDKKARRDAVSKASKQAIAELLASDPSLAGREGEINEHLHDLQSDIVRTQVVEEGIRLDGRRLEEIRPISCEVSVLPRTHGSSLFTRGETQALATVTLGTRRDEQRIDNLQGDVFVRFMLHYNFPPFCTGEVKMLRGQSRREIGHGNLAHRGVECLMPSQDDFNYTVRVVSEVLESNGSSSMATVCSASMALMDAGVPFLKPVAGIAMGLIQEDDKIAVLSDILGDEDHLGDMDFKVVGTKDGITALQMDIKVHGLDRSILEKALRQARNGRLHILKEMSKAISAPRADLSLHAPRIFTLTVKPDKIRDVIGPGGKTIRGIIEQCGVQIDVDDTGKVSIAAKDGESAQKAMDLIKGLTQEPEVGKVYQGIVRKIMEFGAFVEILPGTDGLVHISELADQRVNRVEDIVAEGDEIYVKCIGVDRQGKIRLSRREALQSVGQA
ncbi:polyribonucleotide nucleotidyltransferase [Myxococcota bacterium]|nr:polyribonucleotide nucleotidyltransferase [Myxococcota bacterium]